jgi:hypothetical protein
MPLGAAADRRRVAPPRRLLRLMAGTGCRFALVLYISGGAAFGTSFAVRFRDRGLPCRDRTMPMWFRS